MDSGRLRVIIIFPNILMSKFCYFFREERPSIHCIAIVGLDSYIHIQSIVWTAVGCDWCNEAHHDKRCVKVLKRRKMDISWNPEIWLPCLILPPVWTEKALERDRLPNKDCWLLLVLTRQNKPYDEVLGAAQLTKLIKACKSWTDWDLGLTGLGLGWVRGRAWQ